MRRCEPVTASSGHQDACDVSGCEVSERDINNCIISSGDVSDHDVVACDVTGLDNSRRDVSGYDVNDHHVVACDVSGRDVNHYDVVDGDAGGHDVSGRDVLGLHVSGRHVNDHDDVACDVSGHDISGRDVSGRNVGDQDVVTCDVSSHDVSGCHAIDCTIIGRDFVDHDSDRDIRGRAVSHHDVSDRGASYHDVSDVSYDVCDRDIGDRDISYRDVSNHDVSDRDARYHDVSDIDVSYRDVSNNDVSDRDARYHDVGDLEDRLTNRPPHSSGEDCPVAGDRDNAPFPFDLPQTPRHHHDTSPTNAQPTADDRLPAIWVQHPAETSSRCTTWRPEARSTPCSGGCQPGGVTQLCQLFTPTQPTDPTRRPDSDRLRPECTPTSSPYVIGDVSEDLFESYGNASVVDLTDDGEPTSSNHVTNGARAKKRKSSDAELPARRKSLKLAPEDGSGVCHVTDSPAASPRELCTPVRSGRCVTASRDDIDGDVIIDEVSVDFADRADCDEAKTPEQDRVQLSMSDSVLMRVAEADWSSPMGVAPPAAASDWTMKTPVTSRRASARDADVAMTPMPAYSDMDTPQILKKGKELGLKKALGKKKMKIKLKEVFAYFHQPASSSDDEDDATENLIAQGRVHDVTRRGVNDSTAKKKQAPSNAHPRIEADDGVIAESDVIANKVRGARNNSQEPSSTDGDSDVEDLHTTLFVPALPSSQPDDDVIKKTKKQKKSGAELDAAAYAAVTADPQLYSDVITYRPVYLSRVKRALAAHDVTCTQHELLDYLDRQGITFSTADERKQRPAARRGGRKKRKP